MKFKNTIAFDTFHYSTDETDRERVRIKKKRIIKEEKKERNRDLAYSRCCIERMRTDKII